MFLKTIVFILSIAILATALPQPKRLHYRNLFKKRNEKFSFKSGPRIVGGQEAEPHSLPYTAFLEVFTPTEGWYCGGSLISENYVLTTAHCNDKGVIGYVTLGAHRPLDPEPTQQVFVCRDFIVHENFDREFLLNDIGVVRLPASVYLTDVIQIIPLPTRASINNTYLGLTGRISGWGLTEGFGDQISGSLYFVDVNVISNSDCEKVYGTLPESTICTSGDDEIGSCSGDTGGPLVIDGVQIGVISFGMVFCLPGFPSGYSRVTSFLDWIEANTDVQIQ